MRYRILKRAWGSIPALFLIAVIALIVVLSVRVSSEKERLMAEKLASLRNERPPVNVVVLVLQPRPVKDRLELPGVVEPWVDLSVLAEVPGKVVEVPVSEGDYVKKGDVIALIDSRDYKNRLDSARASHDLAKKNLKRMKSLYEKDLIPKAELDEAQARADTLGAEVGNAMLALERCSIRAPISGIVNRLDAKEGLLLAVSDPVAKVIDISRVKVSVGIPESDVDAVRGLEHFDFEMDALGGKVFRGRKLFISKMPDSRAQLFKLEIAIENPAEEILPGMFAKAHIVKKEVEEGIAVPLYSVINRDNERFVFVEDDGVARSRLVELGILDGWLIQATRGLGASDRVIVVGQRSLEEGQAVNVLRTITDPEELFR